MPHPAYATAYRRDTLQGLNLDLGIFTLELPARPATSSTNEYVIHKGTLPDSLRDLSITASPGISVRDDDDAIIFTTDNAFLAYLG